METPYWPYSHQSKQNHKINNKIRTLPTHTLLNIYQALVAPYLTYGLAIWGQACKSYLDKLLKLQKTSSPLYLFADDTNILYSDKNLKSLELSVSQELNNVYDWLTANKLTLNTKKSNFVIICPPQRKLTYQPRIVMFDSNQNKKVALEHKDYVKLLGILKFVLETPYWPYSHQSKQNRRITHKITTLSANTNSFKYIPSSCSSLFNIWSGDMGPGL